MKINELKKIIPNSENWIYKEDITFGWSGEQKYKIVTNNNKTLLLRLLSFEQYEKQKNGIAFLEKCCKKNQFVPSVLNKGFTLDNSGYFLLLNYIDGNNGMSEIEKQEPDKQYQLGTKMGKIIKTLHSISTPQKDEMYIKTFSDKLNNLYKFFLCNKANLGFLHNTDKYISQLLEIIPKRPVIMLHNDFHLGNMIINSDNISLIDFNRSSVGDNIKEFDCIAWSAIHSELFATGLLDSYIANNNKEKFFQILRLYIAYWELQMLVFIEHEDEEEKQVVLNLIKYTESWFDKDEYIPNWYLKNTKK